MPQKKIVVVVAVVLIAIAASLVTILSRPPEVKVMQAKLAIPVPVSAQFVPEQFATSKGFWQKFGLEVEVIPFKSGADAISALSAGEAQFYHGAGFDTLLAPVLGRPAVAVAQVNDGQDFVLVGGPNDGPVRGPEDLRGKRFGVTRIGTTTWILLVYLAQQHKLVMDKDIYAVPLGASDAQFAALERKEISGFVWSIDGGVAFEEKRLGKIIAKFDDLIPGTGGTWILAYKPVIEENPELVRRFLKAMFYTVDYMNKNPDEAATFAANYLSVSKDNAKRVNEVEKWRADGKNNKKVIDLLIDITVQVGRLKPEQKVSADKIIDERFLPKDLNPLK